MASSELAQNRQLRIRFERDAKTISQLNHPNICTVHDVGESDGISYLVMELLDGESLADRITHGQLPMADVDQGHQFIGSVGGLRSAADSPASPSTGPNEHCDACGSL